SAYDATMALITKRRWQVINTRAPVGNRDGYIEAVARTPIMGFRDDIAGRLRAVGQGGRRDARPAPRYGRIAFGPTPARGRAVLEDIDDSAAVDKPEPARPVQKAKQPPPPAKGHQPAKGR